MTTSRQFAHFRRDVAPPRMKEIPEGGFCISTFLILTGIGSPDLVLMGHINKTGPWDHIGALDAERIEKHSKGWMLPSSALILGESPQDAAERILKEQLNLKIQPLDGPLAFSEVYGSSNHWDLEFLYLGERSDAPSSEVWSELKFVDFTKTRKEDIARGHEDILTHARKWESDH